MADTTNVQVTTPGVWVEAKLGPFTGVVSIAGGGQWCSHTGAPVETLIGHRFTGALTNIELIAGESLYVKADTVTTVILT